MDQLDDDTFEPETNSSNQKVKTRRHFFSTKRSTSSISDNLSRQRAMRKPNNIPVLRKWNSSNGLNPEQPSGSPTNAPSNKMSIQRKVQEIITKRRTNDLNLPLSPTSNHPMLHRSANVIKVKVTGARTTHSVADDSCGNREIHYSRTRISPRIHKSSSSKRTVSESTAYQIFQTPQSALQREGGVRNPRTTQLSPVYDRASSTYSSLFFDVVGGSDPNAEDFQDEETPLIDSDDGVGNDDVFTSNSQDPPKQDHVSIIFTFF